MLILFLNVGISLK